MKKYYIHILFYILTMNALVFSQQALKIGLSSKILTLNPYFALDIESQQICEIIYSGLIDLNNQLETIPVLAKTHTTEWLISKENGSFSLLIPLKNYIEWHDAAKFVNSSNLFTLNPKDIIYSFKLLKNSPFLPYSRKVKDILNIKEVENGVKILFEKGGFSYNDLNFLILPYFFTSRVKPPITPSNFKVGGYVGQNLLVSGTGAYKVQTWDVLMGRMDLVYANNGLLERPPRVSHIHLTVNTDPEARINDLITGNIQLVMDLEPEYAAQIQEPLETIDYPSVYLSAIFFNFDPTRKNYNYLMNKNFRAALYYGIDRRRIYQEVYSVLGEFPVITGPFLPGQGSYNASIEPYEYNFDKAKKLMTDIPENTVFTFLTYDESAKHFNQAICNKIADEYWHELGIKVELDVAPNKRVYFEKLQNGNFDFVLYEWTSSVKPDISMWEKPYFENGVPNKNNFSKYEYLGGTKIPENTFYTDLHTIKYERENNEKILAAYKRVHKVLHEDFAAIFLWNKKIYVAMNRDPKFGFGRKKFPVIKTNPINFLKSIKDW